jgi:hypothetical protein
MVLRCRTRPSNADRYRHLRGSQLGRFKSLAAGPMAQSYGYSRYGGSMGHVGGQFGRRLLGGGLRHRLSVHPRFGPGLETGARYGLLGCPNYVFQLFGRSRDDGNATALPHGRRNGRCPPCRIPAIDSRGNENGGVPAACSPLDTATSLELRARRQGLFSSNLRQKP